MYKQQATLSHNKQCRWIMHGAESSDADHCNAPPARQRHTDVRPRPRAPTHPAQPSGTGRVRADGAWGGWNPGWNRLDRSSNAIQRPLPRRPTGEEIVGMPHAIPTPSFACHP